MSKAIDPFEEYLRRKKVETARDKYKKSSAEAEAKAPSSTQETPVRSQEDPEVEARLQEEVKELFEAGGTAAAALFSEAGSDLSEEKVEEIRDAIEDVFEAPKPTPQKDAGETFLQFFREVEQKFDSPADELRLAGEVEIEVTDEAGATSGADGGSEAGEIVSPPAPAAPPAGGPATAFARPPGASVPPIDGPSSSQLPVDLQIEEDSAAAQSASRISLMELLGAPPQGETQLRQRVDLLCRIVAKLLERSDLDDGEIIEVLIKSGIEF